MGMWILFGLAAIFLVLAIGISIGRALQSSRLTLLINILIDKASASDICLVDFNSINELPLPVKRYFEHVLAKNQKLITIFRMHQSGLIRTSTKTTKWFAFTADQVVVPPATGFVWNAKVAMPLRTHVRVLDSFSAGSGSGRVNFLSAITVASDSGRSELNSAALHRYLAEAVWYPTALLPQCGVVWTALTDEHSALATLTNNGITVCLEFRFNQANEVISIYTPDRYSRIDGRYKQIPWKGHFSNYQVRGGMRIPTYGEVGWKEHRTLQLVWKGNIIDMQYQFAP